MTRTRCPRCAKEGKDTSGNGVKVNSNGTGYCFKCQSFIPSRELKGETVQRTKSSLTIGQVQTFPIGTDPNRKVTQAVASAYGVRHSVDPETGVPSTVFYPSYDEDCNLTGYKVRKLPKNFDACVGSLGSNVFGVNTLNSKSDYLVITEGEEDAMAAAQMLLSTKADVVSLPNGASLSPSVEAVLAKLCERYKRVYLCFDQDTPGKKLTQQAGDLCSSITETRVVVLDGNIGKDASDYLVSGNTVAFKQAIRDAKVHELEGIVNGIDIDLGDMFKPVPSGYPIPFDSLNAKLHGLRKGEIVTVCAGSGIGKTTLVREITLALRKQGLAIANIALENQMQETVASMVAMELNIPVAAFRENPPDPSVYKPVWDSLVSDGNMYFFKHFGGLNSKTLMNTLRAYARTKKVDFIILDHFSLVISASDDSNERKAIDTLMTELAKLVVETGVGLVQIVHLKRPSGDKNFAKGGEVELSDLRGSAAIEQLSWAVIGLERDQQGDDCNFSRIRVLKNRTWGSTGIADTVYYNPATGRMSTYKEDLSSVNDEGDNDSGVSSINSLLDSISGRS